MSNHQDEILKYIKIQAALLSTIQKTLQRIEQNSAPASPNYRRRLSEFTGFDWSSIGAEVLATDDRGPVEVEFNAHRFDRAMGNAYNEPFVIFSRPAPGWTQQNKVYHTLIKFVDYNKTPLDERRPPAPAIKAEPPPRPIQPLDIQQTAPEALEDVTGSSPAAQASPHIAQPITGQPRQVFYELGSKMVNAQKITYQKFNSLVDIANRQGFERAVAELQAIG